MVHDNEHSSRITRFQEKLRASGLEGALLVQATDVFYYAGTRQNATLWIPVAGAPVLLVRKSTARARGESAVTDIRQFPRARDLPAVFGPARRIGFTFDVAPVSVERFWAHALLGVELHDVSHAVREQRSVKSVNELGCMRDTAALLCAVLKEVPSFLQAGLRELDLAAEIEYRLRRAGNEGTPRLRGFNQELFGGVVAAGESAAWPGFFDGAVTGRGLSSAAPIGASSAIIAPDVPVLVDYTATRNGYVVDMTRIAVCGRLPTELERALSVALQIQEEMARQLKPGSIPSELWQRAFEMADAAGLASRFMGPPGHQASFVGHGVGLELDELPVLGPGFDDPLIEGQTLAVEPKFVFPGLGAVGIENTWAVAPRGGEKLTELDDAVLHAAR